MPVAMTRHNTPIIQNAGAEEAAVAKARVLAIEGDVFMCRSREIGLSVRSIPGIRHQIRAEEK